MDLQKDDTAEVTNVALARALWSFDNYDVSLLYRVGLYLFW
jgi:hypothetical protein